MAAAAAEDITAPDDPRPLARGTSFESVMCIGRPTAISTARWIMSSGSRRLVEPSSVIVIVSDGSAVAVHLRERARASVSNPGPRFPDDAGADASPIIEAPVL
jgi:hypothetical protein